MAELQVRPDLSVQRLLGDMAHVSLEPAVRRHGQDPSRWAMPSPAAITASAHDSKAAAAYEGLEQRPRPLQIQDPVVAAATAFFQASKEDQRAAVDDLLEIARQVGPSTEFVADYQLGNYTVAFVGLTEFLLDFCGAGVVRKVLLNWTSGRKLRKALAHEYHPDTPPELGSLDYLLRSDVHSGINRTVKAPKRGEKFFQLLSRAAVHTTPVDGSGKAVRVVPVRVAHEKDFVGGPTAEAPVRIVRQGQSAVVRIHDGVTTPGVESKVLVFEVPEGQIEQFARELITEGFFKVKID